MSAAKRAWARFNHWRKRHWPFRVTILCFLLLNAVLASWYLPSLAKSSCEAILADAEPKVANAIYRSSRADEVRRLQAALTRKLDLDADGALSDSERRAMKPVGLDWAKLTRPPTQADLDHLVAAAHQAGLEPASHSAREIRRNAWNSSVVEAQKIMEPERRKVEAWLVWWRLPDCTAVSTWRKGLSALYEEILLWGLYGFLGNPFHWIPFFVATYLAGVIAVLLLRGQRAAAALLSAVVIAGGINVLWAIVLPHSIRHNWDAPAPAPWASVAFDSLLILAAAAAGARRGATYRNRTLALRRAMLLLGVILVGWGLLPTPGYELRPGFSYWCPFLLDGEIRGGMKAWICVIGLVVLAAEGRLIVMQLRRRAQRQTATA